MSQEQPRRPQDEQEQEPIKYGDVFQVSGELAGLPVAPKDASMMQTAETMVIGQTQKGGPAAAMQSAATRNKRAGLVGHDDATGVTVDQGVTVTEADLPGRRIITEEVAGQVVGQYIQPTPTVYEETLVEEVQETLIGDVGQVQITIGEALEATAHTAGNKPVEQSDAAAIQAAEVRATGTSAVTPSGLAAAAHSAASFNVGMTRDEDKVKLTDVLTGATVKLGADKAATKEDAEGVMSAEVRNNPNMFLHPGGVASSVATAARMNEGT